MYGFRWVSSCVWFFFCLVGFWFFEGGGVGLFGFCFLTKIIMVMITLSQVILCLDIKQSLKLVKQKMPYAKSPLPFNDDRCVDRKMKAPECQSTSHFAFCVCETRATAPQDQHHKQSKLTNAQVMLKCTKTNAPAHCCNW